MIGLTFLIIKLKLQIITYLQILEQKTIKLNVYD